MRNLKDFQIEDIITKLQLINRILDLENGPTLPVHNKTWMLYISTPFSLQCRELQSIITVSVDGLPSLVERVVEKTSSEQLQQCSCLVTCRLELQVRG